MLGPRGQASRRLKPFLLSFLCDKDPTLSVSKAVLKHLSSTLSVFFRPPLSSLSATGSLSGLSGRHPSIPNSPSKSSIKSSKQQRYGYGYDTRDHRDVSEGHDEMRQASRVCLAFNPFTAWAKGSLTQQVISVLIYVIALISPLHTHPLALLALYESSQLLPEACFYPH